MKPTLAAAPAQTWNQKNLPSEFERSEGGGEISEMLQELPAAAVGLMRRRPGLFIFAAVGIAGLVWFLSQRE